MNKFAKLFAGMAVVSLAASCSSDEPMGGNTTPDVADGSTLYLAVNIQDANAVSRADEDLNHGDANENKVSSALFLFYDENGVYVNYGEATYIGETEQSPKPQNISYIGKNMIALANQESGDLPKYMFTVLNYPADFKWGAGMTMEETRNQLVKSYLSTDNNFTMTTTSYLGGDSKKFSDDLYYVNVLTEDNFLKEPVDIKNLSEADQEKVVDVYVERVAAKFQITGVSKTGTIPVKVSVNGLTNEDDVTGSGDEANSDLTTAANLYIKIDGWGLTATETATHMAKNIDGFTAEGANAPFASWNAPARFRSYWGKSKSWGLSSDELTDSLKYYDFVECTAEPTKCLYHFENTNAFAKIRGTDNELIGENVTNIVITAHVCSDDAGNTPVDLVEYNGSYFTYESYKNYVLDNLNRTNSINFHKRTSYTPATETEGAKATYAQVSAADFDFASQAEQGTGAIKVITTLTTATDLYSKSIVDGKEVYTLIEEDENGVTAIDKLNEVLASVNEPNVATAFNGGSMFYSIPVEHSEKVANKVANTYPVEGNGNYGIVRNHWYQLDVTSIKSLGNGVFKPGTGEAGEPLIPKKPKDHYSVGARINILSWRIVTQSVDL